MALSESDRKLLGLVCAHRVLSQDQLQRLFPEVSDRTLRYRTRRLHALGRLGRSRPYRERGSAPWHFWPTRRADALIKGEPTPRRGERAEPGPVFIAHAAAVSELYVALATKPPAGVRLEEFWREPRERFPGADGRERAIAPDATVWLRDDEGRLLVCHVEVDLGTMSRTRLRAKAKGYADPAALREHLRDRTPAGYLLEERFGQTGARALELLLHSSEAVGDRERAALTALAGSDPLSARVGDERPSAAVGQALEELAGHYRQAQLDRLDHLAERYGEGPHLRAARSTLGSGELLSSSDAEDLEREAREDQQVRERQRELHDAYLERREREARRLARPQGLSARLLKGTDAFLQQADELWLRVCPACEEIAYPKPEEQPDELGQPKPGRACPYCHDRGQLEPFSPRWARRLAIESPGAEPA